jgi:hypothetical protein
MKLVQHGRVDVACRCDGSNGVDVGAPICSQQKLVQRAEIRPYSPAVRSIPRPCPLIEIKPELFFRGTLITWRKIVFVMAH